MEMSSKVMKVIIAGSRGVHDYKILAEAMIGANFHITEVVCGGAKGVDAMGDLWARQNAKPITYFLPRWDKLGKSAGIIRNREMANYADALIAIWDGESRGTKNMIEEATNLGLRVYVHKLTQNKKMEPTKNEFVEVFNLVQKQVNQTAHDKGWYGSILNKLLVELDQNKTLEINKAAVRYSLDELRNLVDAQRISLMHSELSEGLEGLRHSNPPSDHIPEFSAIEEELADCIIRIMDISQERRWRTAEALIAKAEFNKSRSIRHGGKAF